MARPAIRDYLRAAAGTDPAGAADADLVARFARSRDETAFELLVWRHAGLVHRVCRSVLGDHHAAEDAAQATFLALARKAGTITGRGAVVGWLYRVARRTSVRLARQRARLAEASDHLDRLPAAAPPGGPEPDDVAAVCAEVDRLPERYRVPVLLCFFEGLTHAEAARRTGWPVGTVAGRLARAKDLLARRLTRRGVGLTAVALPVVVGGFVGPTAAAAVPFAARAAVVPLVKPSVLTLAEGAVRTMTPTVLKLSAASVALAAAVTAGVWAAGPPAQKPAAPPQPVPGGGRPAPAPAERVADAKQRLHGQNNLKQIVLAMHNFLDVNGDLPADITDKAGKPLLSWRVAILPYIEQDQLYKQFKLDEPWDSDHNWKLRAQMPALYRTGIEPKDSFKTYYQGFSGKGAVFEPGVKLKIFSITDGTSNTLAVVEAGPPVEWTQPADIPFDPTKAVPKREGPFKNLMLAATADGAVHTFRPDLPDDVMKLLIVRDDGNVVPDFDTLRPKMVPLTEEDAKLARDVLSANAKLLKAIGEQLAEQQKLLEGAAKGGKPGPMPDVELLLRRQKQLRQALEEIKKETEDLRQTLKAKPEE